MKQAKKAKEKDTIQIKPKEIRNIMEQFKPDILTDSEEMYILKESMQKLQKSDQIIFALYAELESERKVADLLGVSRSPIHKALTKIKEEILKNTQNNDFENKK